MSPSLWRQGATKKRCLCTLHSSGPVDFLSGFVPMSRGNVQPAVFDVREENEDLSRLQGIIYWHANIFLPPNATSCGPSLTMGLRKRKKLFLFNVTGKKRFFFFPKRKREARVFVVMSAKSVFKFRLTKSLSGNQIASWFRDPIGYMGMNCLSDKYPLPRMEHRLTAKLQFAQGFRMNP